MSEIVRTKVYTITVTQVERKDGGIEWYASYHGPGVHNATDNYRTAQEAYAMAGGALGLVKGLEDEKTPGKPA